LEGADGEGRMNWTKVLMWLVLMVVVLIGLILVFGGDSDGTGGGTVEDVDFDLEDLKADHLEDAFLDLEDVDFSLVE